MVNILISTVELVPGFEITACECPSGMARELDHVFPDKGSDSLLAVTTCQHSTVELAQWGEAAAEQKDLLLERFMEFSKVLCEELILRGYWADYIDPCSGLPMIHQCNNVYSEVEGMQVLLGYSIQNAGCCKILLHPAWGSAVYPATLFTSAPLDALKSAMEKGKSALITLMS